jgi:hypothetical protein
MDYWVSNGDETHSKSCYFCGQKLETENCVISYNYNPDSNSHQKYCNVCGYIGEEEDCDNLGVARIEESPNDNCHRI